jgi:hypothetical protein
MKKKKATTTCSKCSRPKVVCECVEQHYLTYRVSTIGENTEPWLAGFRYAVLVGNFWFDASYFREFAPAMEFCDALNAI